MATFAAITLAALVVVAAALHLLTTALVMWRFRGRTQIHPTQPRHGISVLRPVCGLDPDLATTLATSFYGMTAGDEVIFCVARSDDPTIPVLRKLMTEHAGVESKLLVGDDPVSGNPKLNNLVKGWSAARSDWIAMIDSNVLLPRDYVQTLFDTWRVDTGLVSSPPAGTAATNVWARLECAFLNTYQDRWQLAADQLGNGFGQGKVLFWRRDILDAAGGLAALGQELAEDVASTKIVRAAGLKVRIVRRPFSQPLGQRTLVEVWDRQLRWARVRRAGFPLIFALEPLSGVLLPFLALSGLILTGAVAPLVLPVFVVAWYAAEVLLARRAGWPANPADVVMWGLRDAMIPAIWVASFAARGFTWRGTIMDPAADTLQLPE